MKIVPVKLFLMHFSFLLMYILCEVNVPIVQLDLFLEQVVVSTNLDYFFRGD